MARRNATSLAIAQSLMCFQGKAQQTGWTPGQSKLLSTPSRIELLSGLLILAKFFLGICTSIPMSIQNVFHECLEA